MKILLLGKNGQVGQELLGALTTSEVIALGRDEADLGDQASVTQALRHHSPDIIINAAAYTAVDKAESDEAAAMQVNATAVGWMADYARRHNVLLVHYSTDYVFDGLKKQAYTEDDTTHPQSVYGRSKRAGEQAIIDSGCQALIFRTSWVYSVHGGNFVKTMIRLAKERDTVSIVTDQIGAPTSARHIADITAQAISAWAAGRLRAGIYHLTAAGETSWHGLATHVVRRMLARMDEGRASIAPLKLQLENIKPTTTENYPLPAKRPKNSRLDTGTLSAALNVRMPHWSVDVDAVVDRLIEDDT
ncbi:MAG TPA: dTDP-4-dehydrorhamnose reductase [Candidimonas sp.]|nr:dTDP-4-dehydrorhamnose reductase [Candidimonas sp.]